MSASALSAELADQVVVTHRRDHDDGVVVRIAREDARIAFADAPRQPDDREAQLIAAAAGLVAAQASLAPRVALDISTTRRGAIAIARLATLLHGAHAYGQGIADWADPVVELDDATGPATCADPLPRTAILLWSGGKDALAALEVLRANRFEVVGLHVSANPRVEALERTAAERLAELHGLPLLRLTVDWRIVDAMLRRWSTATHRFPLANEIPHGRDVVLVAAAAAAARMYGAGYVTAGYEWDLWTKTVPHRGRAISRHDSQSRAAGVLLDALLRDHLGVRFFSPIAGFSEHTILRHLLEHHADAWAHIASCYWDRWCGQCQKCLRYALAETRLGVRAISFPTSPLDEANPALRALLDRLHDPTIPFWEEQTHALFEICERDPARLGLRTRARLAELRDGYEPLKEAIELTLTAVHSDDLAPAGFAWTFDDSNRIHETR